MIGREFESGDMAEEAHDEFVNRFFPERPDKAAERMRKLLIGPRAAKLFGRDAGKVDGGFGCAGSEEIGDILRDLDTDRLLRFLRGGAEVRCQHDIVECQQRRAGRRLFDINVEGRAGDVPTRECFE